MAKKVNEPEKIRTIEAKPTVEDKKTDAPKVDEPTKEQQEEADKAIADMVQKQKEAEAKVNEKETEDPKPGANVRTIDVKTTNITDISGVPAVKTNKEPLSPSQKRNMSWQAIRDYNK